MWCRTLFRSEPLKLWRIHGGTPHDGCIISKHTTTNIRVFWGSFQLKLKAGESDASKHWQIRQSCWVRIFWPSLTCMDAEILHWWLVMTLPFSSTFGPSPPSHGPKFPHTIPKGLQQLVASPISSKQEMKGANNKGSRKQQNSKDMDLCHLISGKVWLNSFDF